MEVTAGDYAKLSALYRDIAKDESLPEAIRQLARECAHKAIALANCQLDKALYQQLTKNKETKHAQS